MQRTFQELQALVGAWSHENFGEQETPYLYVFRREPEEPITYDLARKDTPVVRRSVPPLAGVSVALGSLAPLLGMAEEAGELAGGDQAGNDEEICDACADIGIYLMDYLCRENIHWPTAARPTDLRAEGTNRIISAVGQLIHVHLKRHQRIRGMHDPELFHRARSSAVLFLIHYLDDYLTTYHGTTLLTLVNKVWAEIVSKRVWVAPAPAEA